ncbi:c-type cytochrome, partial [Bacillus amyloliquefaciens]
MTPRPTNFSIEQPSAARAQAVLTDGIPGTAMTAWAKVLSAGDRAAVVAYIRSLYRPDPFDDAATR